MTNSQKVLAHLKQIFPSSKCELNYTNIYELLISVILSAQCTDKRVNSVTIELFKKYPTPQLMMNANQQDVENLIKTCGMYKQKAKNIINASKKIVTEFNGIVPKTIEELTTLDGVGRKTASVVLCEGYAIPAMPVDTHVFRVSRRLGLSSGDNVLKVEQDLRNLYDKSEWINLHFRLVLFGRYYCKAIKPSCEDCKLKDICKFYQKE